MAQSPHDTGEADGSAAAPPPPPPGAMEDLAQAAFDAANAFGQHLVERNFEAAHAMLSNALKASQSPAELARTVDLMLGNQPARQAAALNTLDDWPDREKDDVLWVYVSISSDDHNEAASVVVTRETGQLVLSSIEWGRP
jgi:hypothetical protein